jgi:hypothetical protein
MRTVRTQKLRKSHVLAILVWQMACAPLAARATVIQTQSGMPDTFPQYVITPQTARTARHLQVGPDRSLKLPSQAAAMARSGDIIEIDAVPYIGDVASWNADNIVIRGVPMPGGEKADAIAPRAHLLAAGRSAEFKAIWVIKGRNVTVENIEFEGAAVSAGNGAGIRAEGANLTIANCYFHDNQEGVLSSIYTTNSVIDIENSEFARNGGNGGQSHEIYISNIRKLIVRGSYFHEGRLGHLIKSRAQMNVIIANRITDEANGHASYEIEFPFGGLNIVIGNLIEQSPGTENSTILANALEGDSNTIQELYVVNNTFVNDLGRGNFIRTSPLTTTKIINNIFVGGGNVLAGGGQLKNNLLAAGAGGAPTVEQTLFRTGTIEETNTITAPDAGLVDIAHYDYRPGPHSRALAGGTDPGSVGGVSLLPALEYFHPAGSRPVIPGKPVDIGAFQHGG